MTTRTPLRAGFVVVASTLLACGGCSGILGIGDYAPEAANDDPDVAQQPGVAPDAEPITDAAAKRDAAIDDSAVDGPGDARAPDPRDVLGSRLLAWLDADDPVRPADGDGTRPMTWPSRGGGFDFVGCQNVAPMPRLRRGLAKFKGQSAFDFGPGGSGSVPGACAASADVLTQIPDAGADDLAVFSVAHYLPDVNAAGFVFLIQGQGDYGAGYVTSGGGLPVGVLAAHWGGAFYGNAEADDLTHIHTTRVSPKLLEIRVDGVPVGTKDLVDAGIYKQLVSGSKLYVGGIAGGGNSVNGKIATLMVALRPTDAEVVLIEAYLRQRYF